MRLVLNMCQFLPSCPLPSACCQVPVSRAQLPSYLLPSCPLPSCLLPSASAIRARLDLKDVQKTKTCEIFRTFLFWNLQLKTYGLVRMILFSSSDAPSFSNTSLLFSNRHFWVLGICLLIYLVNKTPNLMSISFPCLPICVFSFYMCTSVPLVHVHGVLPGKRVPQVIP